MDIAARKKLFSKFSALPPPESFILTSFHVFVERIWLINLTANKLLHSKLKTQKFNYFIHLKQQNLTQTTQELQKVQ